MIRIIRKTLFNSVDIQSMVEQILEALLSASSTPLITTLSSTLREALDKLTDSRINSNHNSQTEALEAADTVRDRAFRAFFAFVEACTIRENRTVQELAKQLWAKMERFDRKLYMLGYQAQTAEMKVFFKEMDNATAELLEPLGAVPWLNEIKQAQASFLAVFSDKMSEEVAKNELLPTKEAREVVLLQLNGLTQTLNGMELAGIDGISSINSQIDTIIEQLEVTARARQSRRQGDDPADNDQGL